VSGFAPERCGMEKDILRSTQENGRSGQSGDPEGNFPRRSCLCEPDDKCLICFFIRQSYVMSFLCLCFWLYAVNIFVFNIEEYQCVI